MKLGNVALEHQPLNICKLLSDTRLVSFTQRELLALQVSFRYNENTIHNSMEGQISHRENGARFWPPS